MKLIDDDFSIFLLRVLDKRFFQYRIYMDLLLSRDWLSGDFGVMAVARLSLQFF